MTLPSSRWVMCTSCLVEDASTPRSTPAGTWRDAPGGSDTLVFELCRPADAGTQRFDEFEHDVGLVQQLVKVELVINLKTARTFGLTSRSRCLAVPTE